MGLRDLLKKKDGLSKADAPDVTETMGRLNTPEFTFIRSDTTTQEIIYPPTLPQDSHSFLSASTKEPRKPRHSLDVFRSGRSRSASQSSQSEKKETRRLSHRLHLSRAPETSESVPQDLPEIVLPSGSDAHDKDNAESQWEKRATILANQNDLARSRPQTPQTEGGGAGAAAGKTSPNPSPSQRSRAPSQSRAVSSKKIDEDIQEAIRLHEEGDLEKSTRIFGILADPTAANNPLSQVLYGLALRHGWGCSPDPAAAVRYLSAAASNAASIEQLALQAGLKKGGAAKGELVLAIFELANCFRHGWGIEKDAYAAKQYYETAANLGDSDAMNEVAWCYLEGFGCKKDKFAAARYYRLAEKAGNKTLGNSWIWKDKYNPPGEGGSSKKK